MNIPHEIIEKAIAGGWRPEINTAIYKYTYKDLVEWYNNSSETLSRYAILDPEFWRCLGKALRWEKQRWEMYLRPSSKGTSIIPFGIPTSKAYGTLFVHLILTQAPQEQKDAFWKDLQGKE